MTLEDFKDVYKDKTPLEKLKLLIVQTDYIRDDVRSLERDRINGNEKGADYMRSEIRAKEERIQWLYDQLVPVLKAQGQENAIPIDWLMCYAQLPTEYAIAEWQKPKQETWIKQIRSRDKPMSFDDALQLVNDQKEATPW